MSDAIDVLVVGAGLAGFTAALAAQAGGARVRVIEQSRDQTHLCNSRYTGGLFHIAMDDMGDAPARVRANLERVTAGTTDPALADALADNARRALRFLAAAGVRFIQAGPDGLRRNSLSPPGVRQTGLHWRGRAGDVMLRTLEDRLVAGGGRVERGLRATALRMAGGRCVGVDLVGADGPVAASAAAVVLADGGFQADPDLLTRFVTPRPDRLLRRNAGTGNGAGLRMAEAVGAKLVGTDRFYGHLHHRRAMDDGALWPYPVVDSLATGGIVVDAEGRRFCDEGLGGVAITNAIARLRDPLEAVLIFDEAIWQGPGRDWLLPANPNLEPAGGAVTVAPTLVGLAEAVGLDPARLEQTVADYNRRIAGHASADPIPRTTLSRKAWPIAVAPFRAIPLCAGITYTMGGIATDACGRVLDATDRPIPGLWAAGATTGGLEGGGPAAGYSGGLSKSAVFGMLAGEAIAAALRNGETAA